MSYHGFFMFAQGLAGPLTVPKGTLAEFNAHVKGVEKVLRIKRIKYLDNPEHWNHFRFNFRHVSDEVLCETARRHNAWVRRVYRLLGEWNKKPSEDGEGLTPEQAQEFWPGLRDVEVPPDRWTADYYRDRMEHLYEVMRGRPSQGVSFDTKALTPEQAAGVINLFSVFLDPDDLRLNVPNGHDYLASSQDGGYVGCEKCGPVHPDECDNCPKRKCPVRAERGV